MTPDLSRIDALAERTRRWPNPGDRCIRRSWGSNYCFRCGRWIAYPGQLCARALVKGGKT